MFHYTAVNLVAFDDGTQVFINSPGGGGTVSLTLEPRPALHQLPHLERGAPSTAPGGHRRDRRPRA